MTKQAFDKIAAHPLSGVDYADERGSFTRRWVRSPCWACCGYGKIGSITTTAGQEPCLTCTGKGVVMVPEFQK